MKKLENVIGCLKIYNLVMFIIILVLLIYIIIQSYQTRIVTDKIYQTIEPLRFEEIIE